MPQPVILHADMDAFYAAIEQLDHPRLRGKPVIVGHPGRRGVVTTASYEARPFGVGSAMPMALAMKKCPDAIVVPPRMQRYSEVSRAVMNVFHDFSPLVEPLSLDEAFLDMTGAESLLGSAAEIGRALKRAVFEATGGLRVSVGLAPTKFVAKVASDHDKPDGLTIVDPSQVTSFLWPLPISSLWGVGPKTQPRLHELGLRTIGDVAHADPGALSAALGTLGEHIHALARGEDPRSVVPCRRAKSIGSEHTLDRDVIGADQIQPLLLRSADNVAYRLRQSQLVAAGVRVKLKTRDFKLRSRQSRLQTPTSNATEIYNAAVELLSRFDLTAPMRLVGLAAFELHDRVDEAQGELFASPETPQRERLDRLDKTLDSVRERFGSVMVRRASDLE